VITALIGTPTRTNVLIADAWRERGVDARVLWPHEARGVLVHGDVALFRLDLLPTLDGVEPGLEIADELETRGVRVLNRPAALLATHDKLRTAELLTRAGVPHPAVVHVVEGAVGVDIPTPCVVKPRFGSWGQDVFLCRTRNELESTLAAIAERGWFVRHGALIQELVGPVTRDLRLVVAGGAVVAAGERTAAPSEWRTNVSLGGRVRPAKPSRQARQLAVAAAQAIDIDVAGVDLLPTDRGWIVLELNGAVDFDEKYTLDDRDPFGAILEALAIDAPRHSELERTEATMTKTVKGEPPRAGDEIVITGHSVGDAPRTATILEVLGEPDHPRYRVRWEDGHESIYFPGADALVRRPARRKTANSA
jgi:RimK family alpha-L-glutamate ligase